jgi:hypothetical protein
MPAEHPTTLIRRMLRERYGVAIEHLDARVKAELDGQEDYLVCGLLWLCTVLLENDDGEVTKWRAARRGETAWPIEELWLAASFVVGVRALGYGRKEACKLVQQAKYPNLKGKTSLYDTLTRAARKGVFKGWRLTSRTRTQARAALKEQGIDIAGDGKLVDQQHSEEVWLWGADEEEETEQ